MSEFKINSQFPKFNDDFSVEFKKFQTKKLDEAEEAPASRQEFASMVDKTLKMIEDTQAESDKAMTDLATGKNKNIHEAMITMEKADMSLKLGMQIRNKIIDAYKEIMRMQV